jgi:hypothetical protein
MKTIRVNISDNTDIQSAASGLNKRLPESTRNSPELLITYQHAISCMEDFLRRAKKLARTGTTMNIQREFCFPNLKLIITLDYPRKIGIIENINNLIKKYLRNGK